MRLHDALFNWLQIYLVSQSRPDDWAAKETEQFFHTILKEDHAIEQIEVVKQDTAYILTYKLAGEEVTQTFDRIQAEQLLQDIMKEPKYNS